MVLQADNFERSLSASLNTKSIGPTMYGLAVARQGFQQMTDDTLCYSYISLQMCKTDELATLNVSLHFRQQAV
jgi:hypothetical protein